MNEIAGGIPTHLMKDPSKDLPRAKNAMGKDDFMKLLMVQLRNQDPLKPMDHHEFAAQLAQFGSLEQLTNIQKGIEGLHTGIGEDSKISALSMIGKKVQAVGNEVQLLEGQTIGINYGSKEGVQPVKASIYSDGGKLIREIDIAKNDGPSVKWDGKDSEGQSMPSGKYNFRVSGVDKNGQSQEINTELGGKVTGVEMDGKVPVLIIETANGKTRLDLAKVKQVTSDSEKVIEGAPKAQVGGAPLTQQAVPNPAVIKPAMESATESDDSALPAVAELDKGMWGGFPGIPSQGGNR